MCVAPSPREGEGWGVGAIVWAAKSAMPQDRFDPPSNSLPGREGGPGTLDQFEA